jgi:hypothetical protein
MNPPVNQPADADASRRMLDELVSRALAYRTSNEFKELVEFSRQFPHLAPFNAMLLHVQNPGVRYALRAPVWEREYGRKVKPAARPHVILQTMGPVAFVFDLSDTEPMDKSLSSSVPAFVENPFPAKGQPPPTALENVKKLCLSMGIVIEEKDYGTEMAGRVQRVSASHYDFHLTVNSKHTAAQRLATISHELGQVFCGHLGASENGW